MRLRLILTTAALSWAMTAVAASAAAECNTGSTEENIAVARNFYVAYNTGDAELLGRTLSEDFVNEPVTPGEPNGPAAMIGRMNFVRATFGSPHIENVDVIAAGDKVVVRSDITGTHSGTFAGLPATGRPLRFGAIDIHTICDGKIVRSNHEEGWLTVMFQLGVLPVRQ